jgi:uracil-DNA glycosylase
MNRLDLVEQIITCTNCELHAGCTAPVPMRGEPGPVAVIGEAPGETEDIEGRPFVGPAGKLLQGILDEYHFPPMGVLNTVSCYPHGTPTWEQIAACAPNKTGQITYFDPMFILLLGKVALTSTSGEDVHDRSGSMAASTSPPTTPPRRSATAPTSPGCAQTWRSSAS